MSEKKKRELDWKILAMAVVVLSVLCYATPMIAQTALTFMDTFGHLSSTVPESVWYGTLILAICFSVMFILCISAICVNLVIIYDEIQTFRHNKRIAG